MTARVIYHMIQNQKIFICWCVFIFTNSCSREWSTDHSNFPHFGTFRALCKILRKKYFIVENISTFNFTSPEIYKMFVSYFGYIAIFFIVRKQKVMHSVSTKSFWNKHIWVTCMCLLAIKAYAHKKYTYVHSYFTFCKANTYAKRYSKKFLDE